MTALRVQTSNWYNTSSNHRSHSSNPTLKNTQGIISGWFLIVICDTVMKLIDQTSSKHLLADFCKMLSEHVQICRNVQLRLLCRQTITKHKPTIGSCSSLLKVVCLNHLPLSVHPLSDETSEVAWTSNLPHIAPHTSKTSPCSPRELLQISQVCADVCCTLLSPFAKVHILLCAQVTYQLRTGMSLP